MDEIDEEYECVYIYYSYEKKKKIILNIVIISEQMKNYVKCKSFQIFLQICALDNNFN